MKQYGLRKTGVRVLDRDGLKPLGVVAAGVAALMIAEKLLHPAMAVSALIALVVTVLVFLGTRRALDIETAFPQLMRIPGMSRLLGESGRP